MSSKPYTPNTGSLADRVCTYFLANPSDELGAFGITVKYGVSNIHNVRAQLAQAVEAEPTHPISRSSSMNAVVVPFSIKTMTSKEIADLVEQRHDNVKRTMETLGEKRVITLPQIEEVTNTGPGPKTIGVYSVGKRDSLIVVAQLCPEYTARIVDRWQYLEEQAAKPIDPMAILSDPAAMRGLLLTYTEKVIALESEVQILAPKARALDRISLSDGSMCITNAAKVLGVQPKKFFAWLQEHQWIYRRGGGSGYTGYQARIQVGYLDHKVTTVERSDGSEKTVEQVLVTAKGLAKLADAMGGQASIAMPA